jgi:hypothetical protein
MTKRKMPTPDSTPAPDFDHGDFDRDHAHSIGGALLPCEVLTHCPSICDCAYDVCTAVVAGLDRAYNMPDDAVPTTCPRCGSTFDGPRGAVSRVDNSTKVCNPCGMAEAMWDWEHAGTEPLPPLDGPVRS